SAITAARTARAESGPSPPARARRGYRAGAVASLPWRSARRPNLGSRFRLTLIIAMMAHPITLIPGDGIGPEVADATSRAVEATGVGIEWEHVDAGARALAEQGQLLPDDVFASLEMTRVGLKGPTTTPIGGGHRSINVALRKKLGLSVNFRPVVTLPGLKTRFADLALDIAIFRENTEDLYAGLEHEVVPGVVESLKIITEKASS